MKTRSFFLLVLIVIQCSLAIAQYDSIPHGNYNRTYLLHLPPNYNSVDSLPLVIAMHGGFGNAYNIQNQSELSLKADAENFIVLYPEGVKGGLYNISSWNAGACCGFASSSNIDDVGFISALLDTIISQYLIDINRIYVTGMSNGGFMSYRLACELSDRIAAIAPVAASITVANCVPVRSVPIISFHSYLDNNIPYYGGVGSGFSNHYNPPQDSVLNAWASMNSCTDINDTIVNNAQYTSIKWTSCDCGIEIHQYVTQDGGHSWPGGTSTVIGDSASNFINATDLMWEFFQQHSLNCIPTFIETINNSKNRFDLFPNPTSGIINIPHNYTGQISILSIEGELIKTINCNSHSLINISHLPNGIYIIKFANNKEVSINKVQLIKK